MQRGSDPDSDGCLPLTNRGNVYLAKGDLDAALKDYDEALKINPNYVRAHASRGQVFEKRGDAPARVPNIVRRAPR